MKICSVEGCGNPHQAKSFCKKHYARFWATGSPCLSGKKIYSNIGVTCRIEGCERKAKAKHMCPLHWNRERKGLDLSAPPVVQKPKGQARHITKDGYVKISDPRSADPKARVLEHRLVVEGRIGRRLMPGETVHHINGVRDDNRSENLELWVSSHPSGQRVEDQIKWAKEILARYDGRTI